MLLIEDISTEDFQSILEWWRLGMPNVEMPTEIWFQYVSTSHNVVCLCLKEKGDVKSYCQADIAGENAAISIVTNPIVRRQGYATKLLRQLQLVLQMKHVKFMDASIEVKNSTSQLLAESCGFARNESVSSDQIEFARKD